jgi:TonB family protein
MTTEFRRAISACALLAAATFCVAGSAAAQVPHADYKALYAAAEYDKALDVVESLDNAEAQQYKALCLLALGRQADANAAIEALVTSSPTFVPSSEEAPPRFVELVTKVRQKLLPVIARRLFAEGRASYTEKQSEEAVRRFSLVLTLLSDSAFADAEAKQDLQTLAQGFIDLAKATPPPAKFTPPPEPPVKATPPPPVVVPPTVTQPTALVQTVPPMPPDIAARVTAKLVLLVLIDETGRVTEATIKESAHPRYDRMVVRASREWRYTPATRDGMPIPSEQTVTIQPKR